MADKKYQVFISSTFADLKEHRQAAMNAVIDLRHIPIGMEGFPAVDQEQMQYITRLIDECDYYVLIVGERYGSKSPNGTSYTELEFDYAVRSGKHVLGFLSEKFEPEKCDDYDSLSSFREKIAKNRIVKFWSDKSALELAVLKSLSNAFEVDPRDGWIRFSSAIDPAVVQQLADARSRVSELERQLAANSPKPIQNLAGLDDKMVLTFERKITYDRGFLPESVTTTWRALFLAIASSFRVAYVPLVLDSALRDFIKLHGKQGYETRFEDAERQRILNQYELLGLMQSSTGKAVSGNYGVFYQLTAQGEMVRMTGLAVKTDNKDRLA